MTNPRGRFGIHGGQYIVPESRPEEKKIRKKWRPL